VRIQAINAGNVMKAAGMFSSAKGGALDLTLIPRKTPGYYDGRADITDVVLSHLHFDAAGGTTREEGGEQRLSFPNATVHVQRRHWKWAHHPTEKDAGSFRRDDFSLLEDGVARGHLGPTRSGATFG